MKQVTVLIAFAMLLQGAVGFAQGIDSGPVFDVRLVPDRAPVVAGEELRLAVVLSIDPGWHVNSDQPGDDFSLPTEVRFRLPEGWPAPVLSFPDGRALTFEFSDSEIDRFVHIIARDMASDLHVIHSDVDIDPMFQLLDIHRDGHIDDPIGEFFYLGYFVDRVLFHRIGDVHMSSHNVDAVLFVLKFNCFRFSFHFVPPFDPLRYLKSRKVATFVLIC